jgi:hypothetical protein
LLARRARALAPDPRPALSCTHALFSHARSADGQVESLFAAELARRAAGGPSPTEPTPGSRPRSPSPSPPPAPAWASDDPDAPPPPQLAASRALASEGLGGLIPRAKALLTLGASFSAAFAGLAAIAAAAFIALAAAFGPAFVHGGRTGAGLPQYVDPYTLIDRRGLLGTDGPDGPMPPPPPGYQKARAAEAAAREGRGGAAEAGVGRE